ncbi:MAG: lipopolysaccharide heptosyltransferase II [Thermodesulfovibrionales bacterium]|nr:lipopolysaccharide heptosyltransferase II [Thermodesulfovibrionales bacterium]
MEKEKIFIKSVNWIGDAVMTLPTIETIKKGFKDCSLSILCKSPIAQIYENSPFIDNIINYNKKDKGIFGRIALSWKLRKERFTRAFLLQNAFDAALVSYMAGIPKRIGYERDSRGWLLTSKIPYNKEDRKIHHIDYFLNIPAYEGIKYHNKEPWIYLKLDERLKARDKIKELSRPILGISPGAAFGETKRWKMERFAEVAKWFITKTSGSVILFSDDPFDKIVYEIDRSLETNKLSLAGQTTVRDLIALISECDLFLTNDSGPHHIAKAVMTPTVSIFASTSPLLTGYNDIGFIPVTSKVNCSPCFKKTCLRGDLACIYDITSDEVFFELDSILPSQKAFFFDRDGTLCDDANYLCKWEDFRLFENISELMRLKEAGFLLIGISNQSGIARGIIKEDFVKEVNQLFIDKYGFDDFYYCPHHPNDHCSCRKPEPGMLLKARAKYKINLKGSFFVGDKESDMLTALSVGAKGILLGTSVPESLKKYGILCVKDIRELVNMILTSFA